MDASGNAKWIGNQILRARQPPLLRTQARRLKRSQRVHHDYETQNNYGTHTPTMAEFYTRRSWCQAKSARKWLSLWDFAAVPSALVLLAGLSPLHWRPRALAASSTLLTSSGAAPLGWPGSGTGCKSGRND